MKRLVIVLPALFALQVGVQPALAWTWPVDGPVLREFDLSDDPYASGQHRGIDVGAAAGRPVLSPVTGAVTFAGTVPGGGRTLTIETGDGYAVTLLHLGTVGVAKGARVAEGAGVATVGPTGELEHAQPYLHLGIRLAADPTGYIDPLLLLPARPAGGVESVPQPGSAPVAAALPPPEGIAPDRSSSTAAQPSARARGVATMPRATAGRTIAPETRVVPVRHPLVALFDPRIEHRRTRIPRADERGVDRSWFAFVLLGAGAGALAVLCRELRDARSANRASPVFLQRLVAPAEDAQSLRLRQEDRLVLDRDLQRVLLTEAEALPDLDRDHDPSELVDVADDARPRHSSARLCGGRHRLARAQPLGTLGRP
jgi:murein DD-endopeptidase MepM/ murein hydrolase activator NlpD